MPWKESSVIDERLRFVARLLDGEPMTQVCRDFGISRKTGYKIFGRYKERGLEALCDRSRSAAGEARQSVAIPARGAHRRHQARETALGRQEDPRAPSTPLARGHPSAREEHCPRRSPSPRPRRPPGRPRHRATGTPLSNGSAPNELWCTDFKGEFKLGNGRYCYPLTVTDHASRYLLLCEALQSTREDLAITAFERLFRERGLPDAIRSDNGVPFASPNALFNLSKLAVWWLRLGIHIER